MYSPPTYTNIMYNNTTNSLSYYQQIEQVEQQQQQGRRVSYCDYLSSSASSQGSFSDYENSPLMAHEDYFSSIVTQQGQQKFSHGNFYPQPFVHSPHHQQQQPGASQQHVYNQHYQPQQQTFDYHSNTSIMIESFPSSFKQQQYEPWLNMYNTSPSCSTTTSSPISSPIPFSSSSSSYPATILEEVVEEAAMVKEEPVNKKSGGGKKKVKMTTRAKRNATNGGVTTSKKQAPSTVKTAKKEEQQEQDKNFPCDHDDCGKVFRRSEHLKRHIRSIHTREKRKFLI